MSRLRDKIVLDALCVNVRRAKQRGRGKWMTLPVGSRNEEVAFDSRSDAALYWSRIASKLLHYSLLAQAMFEAADELGDAERKAFDRWVEGSAKQLPDTLVYRHYESVVVPFDWLHSASELVKREGPLDSITIRMLFLSEKRLRNVAGSTVKDEVYKSDEMAHQDAVGRGPGRR